jgi:hypothetical protein
MLWAMTRNNSARARGLPYLLTVVVALLVVGCDTGGGGNPSITASAGAAAPGDCRIGVCADGLIPELAAVPLPESADQFGLGSADPNDSRRSARQNVYFLEGPVELAEFYEVALPGAGFEVTDSEGGGGFHTFEIIDPDGHSGTLRIRSAATHPGQMYIEIYIYR